MAHPPVRPRVRFFDLDTARRIVALLEADLRLLNQAADSGCCEPEPALPIDPDSPTAVQLCQLDARAWYLEELLRCNGDCLCCENAYPIYKEWHDNCPTQGGS